MKIDTRLAVDWLAIDEAICASIRKFTKDKRSESSEMCSLTKLTCQAIDLKGDWLSGDGWHGFRKYICTIHIPPGEHHGKQHIAT